MTNKNKLTTYYAVSILLYLIVQFFSSTPFFHDKVIVSTQISKSMANDLKLWGEQIPCHNVDGTNSSLGTWAEEPPVYHFLASLFMQIVPKDLYFKLFSALLSSLLVIALLHLISSVSKQKASPLGPSETFLAFLLVIFQPYIFLFYTRPIPDTLATIFTAFFLSYFIAQKHKFAWSFSVLAVTTKAIAIFPIFSTVLSYLFCQKLRENFTHRFIKSALYGLSIIPFIAWLFFLEKYSIQNPFFEEALQISGSHTSGTGEKEIYNLRLFTRVLSWSFVKGTGIPIFILYLMSFVYAVKKTQKSLIDYICLSIPFGHLFYVLMVASPQISAPWYSFYFNIFYTTFAALIFVKIKMHWKIIIILLTALTSLSLADLKPLERQNALIDINSFGADVKCDFHGDSQ